jgi:hypothetical protein
LQALRLVVPALALAVVLSCLLLLLGFTTANRAAEEVPGATRDDHRPVTTTSPPPRDGPQGKVLSNSVRKKEVRGKPIPGLPRPPGSVRVGYAEDRSNGLTTARTEYASGMGPEGVRGFYRDVFRSGNWDVANVEYSGGDWYFLVARGGREASVEVSPRGGGSRVVVEALGPAEGAGQDDWTPADGSKR